MFFNTIIEYDNKLKEMEFHLDRMKKSAKENPDMAGVEYNYRGLNEIYQTILEDREVFLKMMNQNVNLHVNSSYNQIFSLGTMSMIFDSVNNFTFDIANSFKNNSGLNFNRIPVRKVSSGSLHRSFSMGDRNTDLSEVKLNYEIFNALFEIFESGEDIPKLKDKLNDDCIESYKDFLMVLIENELDITLEMSSRSASITHQDALKIYGML